MYIIIIYGNCILHNQINAYFVNVTQKMFGFGLNFSNFLNYLSCSCLSFYTRPNFHHLCKQPQKWLGFPSPSFYIHIHISTLFHFQCILIFTQSLLQIQCVVQKFGQRQYQYRANVTFIRREHPARISKRYKFPIWQLYDSETRPDGWRSSGNLTCHF